MCLDSKFCLPHTEIGEVEYDIPKMLDYIKKLEKIISLQKEK